MKKRMVAATMTVAGSLGLGCSPAAVAQTPEVQQQPDAGAVSTAPAPAPDAVPQDAGSVPAAPESAAAPSEAAPAAATAAPAAGAESPEAGAAPAAPEAAAQAPEAAPAPEAPAAADAGTGIETVVVTARRSAENIQKVPVAITAFSDKDLQRQQITTGQDLAGKVPSLVISSGSQTRNTETPTIRGQGSTFGSSPGVLIYYGEVPLPSDQFSNGQGGPGKFFDLANLQVLKGSQGTLFGRNTTGGALILEPHKPDPYFYASVKGETSNLQGKGVEGVVNMPVIEDQLYLRLGAKFYERKGFTKDVVTGAEYDGKGFRTFRLGLMWKPTDGISNYLLGYYTHSADSGTSQVLEAINNTTYFPNLLPIFQKPGCGFVALAGDRSGTCGQDLIAAQQARGNRAVALDNPPDDILDTQALIDNFSYQFNDQLTLRNIFSYSLYKHSFRWDADGSPLPINDIGYPVNTTSSDTSTYTEEVQLQGNFLDRTLKLVEGVYYEYLEPNGPEQSLTRNLGITHTTQDYQVKHRTYGPYVQGTYNLGGLFDALDGLNFTAGGRYSVYDESGTASVITHIDIPPFDTGTPHSARVKSEAPTYTAGFDYKLPTTLVYAKISRGYKSGGFSAAASNPADFTFKPEFVFNYEIGSKSDFMIGDMPARVNSAVYYTDYTDMQRTSGDSYKGGFGDATYNAGKASIMGFETDATIQPLPGLTVMANYAYTYGKYKEYTLQYSSTYDLPLTDCNGTTMQTLPTPTTMHLECIPFQYVPRHQASTSVRYQLPIDEAVGKVDGTVTYSFTDRQYSSATSLPSEEPGAWLGAYGLLSASVGWTNIYGSAFDLQLFGANLTDRDYRIANSNQWTLFFFQSSIYGEPRTFGLSMNYHWGN